MSKQQPVKDIEVVSPPTDGISSLTWSPTANYLVAGSWDCQVRLWEINQNLQSNPVAAMNHGAPVLCTAVSLDGSLIFSGGCDRTAKVWDATTGQTIVVGEHNAPVKECFHAGDNLLATGSWDATVRYWDIRGGGMQFGVETGERVYAMDCKVPVCVVATADRKLIVYDLRQPTVEFARMDSPLKYQSRCVAIFPDQSGFALGSIEGRVAIQYFVDTNPSRNFAFKCHRIEQNIHAVNKMSFHPTLQTFATCGSDGAYTFWDKDNRQRLKLYQGEKAVKDTPLPISTCAFNATGNILALAYSYDWSKGSEYQNPQKTIHAIRLHRCTDDDISPRPKK